MRVRRTDCFRLWRKRRGDVDAGEATAAGAAAAEDAKPRIAAALPSLDGVVDAVDRNDADGSATVTTTLRPSGSAASMVESACGAVNQAVGGTTNRLVILGAGGATIASC